MHVQSISHWAPANIGPYSQAVRIGSIIQLAGQIALIPGNMTMISGGIRQQCMLTLRHIDRLLTAMDSNLNVRDVVQVIRKLLIFVYICLLNVLTIGYYQIFVYLFAGHLLCKRHNISKTCQGTLGRKNK